MKDRIENEVVKAGELERNVKLGRGGIREIEFVVQALQLLRAGRQPFLQGAQTLPCLDKLAQYELLSAEDARLLAEAYAFLRDVEHRLQMEDNLQTHTIPARPARPGTPGPFDGLRDARRVREQRARPTRTTCAGFSTGCSRPTRARAEAPSPFPREFEGAEAEWKQLLAEHSFKDVDKAFRVLREFVEGPGYVHVSPRTSELAHQLLPRLFALCPQPKAR